MANTLIFIDYIYILHVYSSYLTSSPSPQWLPVFIEHPRGTVNRYPYRLYSLATQSLVKLRTSISRTASNSAGSASSTTESCTRLIIRVFIPDAFKSFHTPRTTNRMISAVASACTG